MATRGSIQVARFGRKPPFVELSSPSPEP